MTSRTITSAANREQSMMMSLDGRNIDDAEQYVSSVAGVIKAHFGGLAAPTELAEQLTRLAEAAKAYTSLAHHVLRLASIAGVVDKSRT